jgi:predicted  nucleic acid-binding Zn-ribbon protein
MPHQCTDCSRRFDDGSKEMLSGCPNCGGNKFQYIPTAEIEADGAPGETPADRSRSGDPDSTVARTVGSAATAVRDLVGGSSGSDKSAKSDVSASPEAATEGGARSATTAGSTETGSPSSPTAANRDATTNTDTTAYAEAAPKTPETGGPDAGTVVGSTRSGDVEATTDTRDIEATTDTSEDAAQASARSELVSPDELPSVSEDRSGWEQTTPAPAQDPQASGPEPDADHETRSPDETATERPDLSELREELNQQFESIKVVEPGQYELNLMELFDRQEYIIALQEDGKYTVQVPEHWQD